MAIERSTQDTIALQAVRELSGMPQGEIHDMPAELVWRMTNGIIEQRIESVALWLANLLILQEQPRGYEISPGVQQLGETIMTLIESQRDTLRIDRNAVNAGVLTNERFVPTCNAIQDASTSLAFTIGFRYGSNNGKLDISGLLVDLKNYLLVYQEFAHLYLTGERPGLFLNRALNLPSHRATLLSWFKLTAQLFDVLEKLPSFKQMNLAVLLAACAKLSKPDYEREFQDHIVLTEGQVAFFNPEIQAAQI